MRQTLPFVLFLFIGLSQGYAQGKLISGTVTSAENGDRLPGVTVTVKENSSVGTVTDSDGKYTLDVPNNATVLIFSYIGMLAQEVSIGANTVLNVSLRTDTKQLSEVVVTAIGIEREKKSLSYAVSELSGEDVNNNGQSNLVQSLSGKVAGVNVTQSSGAIGGSSRIILRGYSSINGNNQPLFVVDGIPVDNSNFSTDPDGRMISRAGIDYGNAAMDLNPNDIESISVLKGASAAALYGSRASNGAVLITTKKGSRNKAIGISVNSSVGFSNPLKLPKYQNTYGQGYSTDYGFPVNSGLSVVRPEGGEPDESWGPKMEGQLELNPVTNQMEPFVPQPNNRKDFYNTGQIWNNSVSIGGGTEKFEFRLSYSNMNQTGIMPTSRYQKDNFLLNAQYQFNDKLKASVSANYINTRGHNRDPQGQYGGSINTMFLWSARSFDWKKWKDYRDADGMPMTWNPQFWDNPWFVIEQNTNDDNKDRIIANSTIEYEILKGLKITGRAGIDTYADSRQERWGFNSIGAGFPHGHFVNQEIKVKGINTDLFLTYNKSFGKDFSLTGILGHNVRQNNFSEVRIEANSLIVPGIYNLSNAVSSTNTNTTTLRRLTGVYASASLGYKGFLYLELTGRNDWSSTLPKKNNSYFYPSVGAGFVFSEAFLPVKAIVSYGKIRASWAQAGNDAEPYQLNQLYHNGQVFDGLFNNINFPFRGRGGFEISNVKANPDLKPELLTSVEIGTELKFLNNRLNLDATLYNQVSKDQIILQALPPSTGFSYQTINAGEISNKGIELLVGGSPIKTKSGFEWNVSINYTKNKSKIVSLADGIEAITLAGGFTSTSVQARVGEPFGAIYGTYYLRDPQGNLIVNRTSGLPVISSDEKVIGNSQPRWMGGVRNTISYKGLIFSFLIDTKQGGNLHSTSVELLRNSGQVKETETLFGYTREEEFVIPNSVIQNEDGTFSPNTTPTTIDAYYHNPVFSASDQSVFDASYIKLREVSLSYSLPKKWYSKLPFESVNLYASGYNLALWGTNIPHIDPDTNLAATTSNYQGIEYANTPSLRTYTFGLRFNL